jgi:NIMA (never in mitosis gene a)-related kinase
VKRIADQAEYALKKVKLQNLNDKEKLNALNEIRILASVKSQNIVQYREAFIEE